MTTRAETPPTWAKPTAPEEPLGERCPRCGHDWARLAPGRGPHVAAWRCANSDHWVRWVPKALFEHLTQIEREEALRRAARGEPR
jgi:hypothetical protein